MKFIRKYLDMAIGAELGLTRVWGIVPGAMAHRAGVDQLVYVVTVET